MKTALQAFAKEYLSGLRHYLSGQGEAALQSAYEIGRKCIAEGVGGLDIVAIHRRSLLTIMRNVRTEQDPVQVAELACTFLAESLSPFEMALRGFQEMLARAHSEASQRFAFLAEIGTLLVTPLDCEITFDAVAQRIVSYMADGCWIFLAEPQCGMRLICSAYAKGISSSNSERAVLQLSDMEILPEDRGSMILEEVPQHWRDVFSWPQFQSLMIVRMLTQSCTQGIIVFGARDKSHYRQDDLVLAEDVARRCALAAANATLYRAMTAERDKAAEASRAKDDFLGILGHELRNPLVPILGWARNLRKDPAVVTNLTLSRGVDTLERNARNILRLADDCLDLVRISERKVTLKMELLDLNTLVQNCMEALRPAAQEKGLKIVTELPTSALHVVADRSRVEQVMNNLLINAIRYTDAGGMLFIRTEQLEQHAEVEIRDTGMGIDSEFLEQIFEPFCMGRGQSSSADAGLGLGLAIARRLIEMHNGTISAESLGLGLGSTFRVRLRLAFARATVSAAVPAVKRPAITGSVCILLIDDQQDVSELMRMELEAIGYKVLTADDGQSGLELAAQSVPDIIISDIRMPGMDGYELVRSIRNTASLAAIPVIAVTGMSMKKNVASALAAGYDAHINKPVEIGELCDVIQSLIRQKRSASAVV